MHARLSLLCCTSAPAAQVAAVLGPLRPVVGEIVLCVEPGGPASAVYEGLADRVVRAEEPEPGAGGAWPYSACRGDWILRIDGDEVASTALIASLRSMTPATGLLQVWLPSRWLLPDGRSWVRAHPWWPGHEARLVRNDSTSPIAGAPPGRPAPAFPARYGEAPVYRLGLRADELPRGVASEPVDERDLPAVAAVLAAAEPYARPSSPPPPAAPELGEGAHAGALHLLDDDALRLAPGQTRELLVRVENLGDARWPWGLVQRPLVRVGYHVRDRTAGIVSEGPRSALTEDVRPGASSVVPVSITAPTRPGDYEVQLDLVEEGVRWFQCSVTTRMVVDAADAPAPGAPLPPPADHARPPFDLLSARRDFPRRTEPPERAYVVCATPRSGSTLLCRGLIAAGGAGIPAEYLNPIHREDLRRRWRIESSLDAYLETLFALRTSPEGVFGLKLHWEQFEAVQPELSSGDGGLRDGALERLVPGARYVRIVRGDHDRQAVSMWRAVYSGRWAKTDATAHETDEEREYRFEEIEAFRRVLEHGELAWERYLRFNGLTAYTVLYEDLAERYEETVRGTLAFLGLDDGVPVPPPDLRVQRDATSARVLERYLADRAAL